MPMQFFPQQNLQAPPRPEKPQGLGGAIGAALGQGLAQGVSSSLNQTIHQKQLERALGGLPHDATAEQIFKVLSGQPPEVQQLAIQAYLPLKEMESKNIKSKQQMQANSVLTKYLVKTLADEEGIDADSLNPEKLDKMKPSEVYDKTRKIQEIDELANAFQNASPDQQKFMLDQLEKNKEFNQKKSEAAFKQHEKYIEKINDSRDAAQAEIEKIFRERELNESPNLDTPWNIRVAYFTGTENKLHPDTIALQKSLSTRLLHAGESFDSGKLTNQMLSGYEKTIPTIMLAPEARDRLFDIFQFEAKAKMAEATAYDEIMQGRKYPPTDLRKLVFERARQLRNEYAEKFKQGMNELIKEGQQAKKELDRTNKKPTLPAYAKQPDSEKDFFPEEEPAKKKEKISEKIPEEPKKPYAGEGGWEGLKHQFSKEGIKEAFTAGGEDEINASKIGRTVAGAASKIAESVGGFAGDINEWIDTKIQGNKYGAFKRWQESTKALRKILPTSKSIHGWTNYLTGDYLDPRTGIGSFVQDGMATTGLLMLGGMGTIRALGVAGISEGAYEGSKLFTNDPSKQQTARIATSIMASLYNPKKAAKVVPELYDLAYESIPAKQVAKQVKTGPGKYGIKLEIAKKMNEKIPPSHIETAPIIQKLDALTEDLKQGGHKPQSTTKPLKAIEDIKGILDKPSVDVRDILKAKKNINETLSDIWYTTESSPKSRVVTKKKFNDVRKVMDDALTAYGKKNPEFGIRFRTAEEAYIAKAKAEEISENISGVINDISHKIPVLGSLIKKSSYKTTKGIAIPFDVVYRHYKSSTWRNYYNQSLIAASKNNIPLLTTSLLKLEEETKKIDESRKERKKIYEAKKKKLQELYGE